MKSSLDTNNNAITPPGMVAIGPALTLSQVLTPHPPTGPQRPAHSLSLDMPSTGSEADVTPNPSAAATK